MKILSAVSDTSEDAACALVEVTEDLAKLLLTGRKKLLELMGVFPRELHPLAESHPQILVSKSPYLAELTFIANDQVQFYNRDPIRMPESDEKKDLAYNFYEEAMNDYAVVPEGLELNVSGEGAIEAEGTDLDLLILAESIWFFRSYDGERVLSTSSFSYDVLKQLL